MTTNITNILGFDISTQSVVEIVEYGLNSNQQKIINTLNPHSYVTQKSSDPFNNALQNSDILIPDGSGIVIAAKLINNTIINKVAGYDLFIQTMIKLNEVGGKVFLLGSTEFVLSEMIRKAKNDFPNVKVNTLSPAFKPEFGNDDFKSFSESINNFMPDVVFVGLTAPKQEILINSLKAYTNVKFLSGIGAVFDFYAGTVERPNKVWISLHLEWLPRLIKEPKRLWKRNFISTPIFIFDVLTSIFKSNS